MIISRDTNPEYDLYFIGSKIIEALIELDIEAVSYLELYELVNFKVTVTNNLYTLSLIWLFLLEAVKLSESGDIIKCF